MAIRSVVVRGRPCERRGAGESPPDPVSEVIHHRLVAVAGRVRRTTINEVTEEVVIFDQFHDRRGRLLWITAVIDEPFFFAVPQAGDLLTVGAVAAGDERGSGDETVEHYQPHPSRKQQICRQHLGAVRSEPRPEILQPWLAIGAHADVVLTGSGADQRQPESGMDRADPFGGIEEHVDALVRPEAAEEDLHGAVIEFEVAPQRGNRTGAKGRQVAAHLRGVDGVVHHGDQLTIKTEVGDDVRGQLGVGKPPEQPVVEDQIGGLFYDDQVPASQFGGEGLPDQVLPADIEGATRQMPSRRMSIASFRGSSWGWSIAMEEQQFDAIPREVVARGRPA